MLKTLLSKLFGSSSEPEPKDDSRKLLGHKKTGEREYTLFYSDGSERKVQIMSNDMWRRIQKAKENLDNK